MSSLPYKAIPYVALVIPAAILLIFGGMFHIPSEYRVAAAIGILAFAAVAYVARRSGSKRKTATRRLALLAVGLIFLISGIYGGSLLYEEGWSWYGACSVFLALVMGIYPIWIFVKYHKKAEATAIEAPDKEKGRGLS
jgi:MFS family permease